MTEEKLTDAITELDEDVLQRYYLMKETLAEKKPKKRVWVKLTALAACLALLVGTVLAVPGLREGVSGLIDDIAAALQLRTDPPVVKPPVVDPPIVDPPVVDPPVVGPYYPAGEPWVPVFDSDVKEMILNTEYAGAVFDYLNEPTYGITDYTEIYALSPEHLGVTPLTQAEYLPIYRAGSVTVSREEFAGFVDKHLDAAVELFGFAAKDFQINQRESSFGTTYSAQLTEKQYELNFASRFNYTYMFYKNDADPRLKIHNEMVHILHTDTDEQIKEKLKDTIAALNAAFGKNYSDVKICRASAGANVATISVVLYTPEDTVFPTGVSNTINSTMMLTWLPVTSKPPAVSEYMMLAFNAKWNDNVNEYYYWEGGYDQAFLTDLILVETVEKPSDYFQVEGKAKMLTLEEAEKLLEKGYVFGGHSCPICMANQPEVDFSEYTCVDIEYLSDKRLNLYIPFYAFYKYIGETAAGTGIYAKTYVPAVEIEGLEEYFKLQESKHPNW